MRLSDEENRGILIQQYYEMFFYDLLRIALKITKNMSDSEEAVQETFVIAHEKIDSIRDKTKIKNWLITINCNVCKRMLREKKRLVETEYCQKIIEKNRYEDPVKYIEVEEEEKKILELIKELKVEYKQVVILYYYYQYSYKEISKYLNISSGTVKSRLWRAKDILKVKINEEMLKVQ